MALTPFVDLHVHAESRSSEDFARLAAAGCQGILAVAGPGAGYSAPASILDQFRRLDRLDRKRIEQAGLKAFIALGVHPSGIPEQGVDEILGALPGALQRHRAAAVGEIGLEQGGELEERVFLAQLPVAADLGLPAIIHTPREKKAAALARILSLLGRTSLPPERVLLDHLDEEALGAARSSGCLLGLTVQPAKLSPQRAAGMVAHDPAAPFVLSTDLGANPSHLFGIPAAIAAMEELGVEEEVIRAAAYRRAASLLGLLR